MYILSMCIYINYTFIGPGTLEQTGVMCSSNGRQGKDNGGY